jgi:hypothetical protein
MTERRETSMRVNQVYMFPEENRAKVRKESQEIR